MLRADNKLDDISNALGHARQETAEVYLERDEGKIVVVKHFCNICG